MKKLICWMLTLTMAVACALPVAAADVEPGEGTPAPAVVNTIAELMEAIEDAEDGDTINVGNTMALPGDMTIGTEEKHITLMRDESFTDECFFFIPANVAITFQNLTIDGNGMEATGIFSYADELCLKNVSVRNHKEGAIEVDRGKLIVEDCCFVDNLSGAWGHIRLNSYATAVISGSSFVRGSTYDSVGGAILSYADDIVIENCLFAENHSYGGGAAIYNAAGKCEIKATRIVNNETLDGISIDREGKGGGIYNGGTLILSDTQIYGNTAQQCGADIFSDGALYISVTGDNLAEIYQEGSRTPLGFYADFADTRFNGETNVTEFQPLPISKESDVAALIFVFEDDIAAQDDESTKGSQEPEEPQEPDSGGDQSGDDEPSEEGPTGPQEQEPQEKPSRPVTTGPSIHRPTSGGSYTPPSDDGSNREPVTSSEPEPPALICGGAVLDTSNRAYLAGYGNGVIGEDDLITRAQIAQVIYRLLTEESRKALETTENSFEDVSASAWYNLPVSTIAHAGIVVGYGDNFHPEDYLTRAQIITILARFIAPVERKSSFKDISGHWAEAFVSTAEAAGWLYGGGNLRPDEYVTRGEVVSFINHAFDLCEKTE